MAVGAGIDDVKVRGVIAQQVAEHFPEYVRTIENYELPGTDFKLDQFMEVNKQALSIDLLAAMQAQHRRFNVAAKSATSVVM